MNHEIIELQVMGIGEKSTLIPVGDLKEQKKMLRLAQAVDILAMAKNHYGQPVVEMPTTTIYCQLPRHSKPRQKKMHQLSKLVKAIRTTPGVRVRISERKKNHASHHPGRQKKYRNDPQLR